MCFLNVFIMVCEKWELKFTMKKVKEARDLARFVAREFSDLEYLMLIVDKLELLKKILLNTPERN